MIFFGLIVLFLQYNTYGIFCLKNAQTRMGKYRYPGRAVQCSTILMPEIQLEILGVV